jgi:hypothetical protein
MQLAWPCDLVQTKPTVSGEAKESAAAAITWLLDGNSALPLVRLLLRVRWCCSFIA